MRRYWLAAVICALLLTAGCWGVLRVWQETSGSGFAAPERLFGVGASGSVDEGIEIAAELFGEELRIDIGKETLGDAVFAAKAAWLALPPGPRAVYTLAVYAAGSLFH